MSQHPTTPSRIRPRGQTPPAVASSVCRVGLAFCVAAVALATSGCGGAARRELVGRWEGRPDSAQAYQSRQEAAAAAAAVDGADEIAALAARALASPPFPDPTQLEQYEVRVTLDLARDGSATMWLGDGRERLSGLWVVTPVDEHQSILQIATQPDDDQQPAERRRFEIRWDADREGFTLREEDADAQLGWLYFRKVKS